MDDNENYNDLTMNSENNDSSIFKLSQTDYEESKEIVLGEESGYPTYLNNSTNVDSTNYDPTINATYNPTESIKEPLSSSSTLLESGIHDKINNYLTNTYYYSSSEENPININFKVNNTITPAELEQQLTFKEPQIHNFSSNKREVKNEIQQPQKISTATTTNLRNLPISNRHAIQGVTVNAANSNEKIGNDNYASILGK